MSRDNKVKLKFSDDEIFEVDVLVASESQTVKNIIEARGTETAIPLPDVSSNILSKVIEYCRYHVESQKSSDETPPVPEGEIEQWDAEFVKVDHETLYALIQTAIDLNIKDLLNLTSRTLADNMAAAKSEDDIKSILNRKNDFSPEEDEENRREYPWASQ